MKPAIVIAALFLIFAQFAPAGAEQLKVIGTNISSGVNAPDTGAPSINPDSFLWGFKDAFDKFSLAMTFDSEAKAKKSITLAEERFREFQKMAESGKLDAAKKAKESHDGFLETADSAAKSISENNKTEEIKKQIEVEKEVEDYQNRINDTETFLEGKLGVRGNLTAEQRAFIGALIQSMQNSTSSLKIGINKNKEKAKAEIKARTNKSDEEIENETEGFEKAYNLSIVSERAQKRANETIYGAKEGIAKLTDEIEINNVTDNAVLVLMNNSLGKLAEAQNAMNASKYGEAYGLANVAKQLAENALGLIENHGDAEREKEKEHNQTQNETKGREPKMCAQVITPAKNGKTGECKDFPTPCDVPDGWKKIDSCFQDNTELVLKNGTSFELFNESYQNMQKCKEMGIPEVMGGCILQNVSYDKLYVSEAEGRIVGDCWATKIHTFIGIKKGETEIVTKGTCDYNKVYKIKIV